MFYTRLGLIIGFLLRGKILPQMNFNITIYNQQLIVATNDVYLHGVWQVQSQSFLGLHQWVSVHWAVLLYGSSKLAIHLVHAGMDPELRGQLLVCAEGRRKEKYLNLTNISRTHVFYMDLLHVDCLRRPSYYIYWWIYRKLYNQISLLTHTLYYSVQYVCFMF